MFLGRGAFILVADRAALAKHREIAALVGAALSFPRHAAMRCSLRVSYFLRPCSLPVLSVPRPALRSLAPPGPAMGRRADVGVGDFRVPRTGGSHHDALAIAASEQDRRILAACLATLAAGEVFLDWESEWIGCGGWI